jgi:hypothetical protein
VNNCSVFCYWINYGNKIEGGEEGEGGEGEGEAGVKVGKEDTIPTLTRPHLTLTHPHPQNVIYLLSFLYLWNSRFSCIFLKKIVIH